MQGVKIDQALKVGIVLLMGVLVFTIYTGIHERIVGVGDTAPDFKITADNGKTFTRSDFGGKLLVLNFWATWCAPCVQEVPSLDQFSKTVAGSGVVVLGVSVDKDPKTYNQFLKKANVSFITARNPEAKISADFGTFKYPETYIIDSKGKVLQKVIGATNWSDPQVLSDVRSML